MFTFLRLRYSAVRHWLIQTADLSHIPLSQKQHTAHNQTMFRANNIVKRLSSTFTVQINRDGVALLTLQRPPVNSLNLELLTSIKTSLQRLEHAKIRGAILTSALRTFSAGLDLRVLYEPDPNRVRALWTCLQDVWIALYSAPYPTVAVVNGPAPAAGCLLAMCCEYRLIVPKTFLGLSESVVGLVAPPLFAATMINLIGRRQSELALTSGKLFSSEEALKVGLVDEIVESKKEGLGRAQEFLERFSEVPPWARGEAKRAARSETVRDMVEGREEDLKGFLEMVQRRDVQEFMGRHLEGLTKRVE